MIILREQENYLRKKSNYRGIKVMITIYYMHNKKISRFLNKLKAIITSGLRKFISSKEIFPPSRFYFSSAIVLC